VNAFKALAKEPRVVPGAGATEIALSKALQAHGDTTPGLAQYAIKKYGEAFEVVPRTLAENAGLKAIDIIASLYAAHNKGTGTDGVNVEDGTIQNAAQLGVWDLYATKASAIRLATHAAVTVLQVDQIIMSKPAGGPKIPKQGAMDDD
jgi:T-complex protein 1 subunit theta